jgi:hypothetical protein
LLRKRRFDVAHHYDAVKSLLLTEAPKVRNSHSPAATPWVRIFLYSIALKGRHNLVDANYAALSGLIHFPVFSQDGCPGLWLFRTFGSSIRRQAF